MTSNKYKEIIEASGGFTNAKNRRRSGDRPQPLEAEDERFLTEAWKNTSKPAETNENSERTKVKQPA